MKKLKFGYVCNNVPIELLHCFNIEPVRLFGTITDFSTSDKHFPAFCCSFVKSVFAEYKNRDDLDGVISSITCDAIMTLGDILDINKNGTYSYTFLTPVSTYSREAEEFYLAELKRLKRFCEEITGSPLSLSQLRESIKTSYMVSVKVGAIVKKLGKISHDQHKYSDWLQFLHNEYTSNPGHLLEKMEQFENQLPEEEDRKKLQTVYLGGNIGYVHNVLEAIEESGLKIVDDSLCFSGRMFKRVFSEKDIHQLDTLNEDELFGVLVKKYLGQYPCYSRNLKNGDINRDKEIFNDIKESNAGSVIFINIKYCDPNALQYYNLNKILKKEGIPSLFIEYDCQSTNIQQLITRVEAFSEFI
jgi:benzoyl-CoA reductase/2-hydroxyglutaryl-CoA dehydratase subunit BcrC/BadD/HgdB